LVILPLLVSSQIGLKGEYWEINRRSTFYPNRSTHDARCCLESPATVRYDSTVSDHFRMHQAAQAASRAMSHF
jgi:hypothetical protein